MLLLLWLVQAPVRVAAAETVPANPPDLPAIVIIIDDLGYLREEGTRALALPGKVTYAILPGTPFASLLAEQAYQAGKEVMLHLPLQAADMSKRLGPGGIELDTGHQALIDSLSESLASVPHVQGVNNHMGSLLTMHPGHMSWLMQELKRRGLYFVDSFTTPRSIALKMAQEAGVPAVRRHVFLDRNPGARAIELELERLKLHAQRHGYAVGIGHPIAETLGVLEQSLPGLEQQGYRLLYAGEIIRLRQEGE